MMTLEKFEEASELVKKVTNPTKLVFSEYLSTQTGAKVYLKPENMQHTGAYKIRGAYYKISTLTEEERNRGLITASAGNHAQGVAFAAREFGCKATIVMPTVTPLIKVNRTKSYGAEVVLHGDVYDDAYQYACKLAEENGYTFVHPFNDLDVVTGLSKYSPVRPSRRRTFPSLESGTPFQSSLWALFSERNCSTSGRSSSPCFFSNSSHSRFT